MKKKLFITTPIYYPSGDPHIGHVYSTYIADALKDYYKLIGYETYFLTGSDEHGQKIEQAAYEANLDPLTYLNQKVNVFKKLWKLMDFQYDQFIRTSDLKHTKIVQKIFQKLQELDLIYLDTWTGLYCISCEENYTKEQVINKDNQIFCVHGHNLIKTNEPSYFLKVNLFQNWIKNFFIKNDFIVPANRKNELLNNFINQNLENLSVSRTKIKWGIQILNNPNHVIYVWIDALCNYISALGYLSENDQLFQKFWNDPQTKIIHVTAKEISRFHAIYWPIILHALNLRMFNKLISHGWILNNNTKMSKSLNNSIDPFYIIKNFPLDGFRYYLLTFDFYKDNSFSYDELIVNYNHYLVNLYGNLISRLVGMTKKYVNNKITPIDSNKFSKEIYEVYENANNLIKQFIFLVEADNLANLISEINSIIIQCNKLIEIIKPWNCWKNNDLLTIKSLLFVLHKVAVFSTFAYQPICKSTSQKAFEILGLINQKINLKWFKENNHFCEWIINSEILSVLYPRLELNHFEHINETSK